MAELSPTMANVAAAGFTVLEYDLSPDGQEFEEPVTITFTVNRATLGLEKGALPRCALLLLAAQTTASTKAIKTTEPARRRGVRGG